MTRKVKKLSLIFAVLLVFVFSIPAAALTTAKTLQAYYGVKILYNNQVLSGTNQPFIVNGTTYVPLRMLMETFGDKQIAWDGVNNQVIINSSISQLEQQYMQQILSRNKQIEDLEAQVKKLELDNDYLIKEADALDLEDLENDLDDYYRDYYEDLDLSVSLSGDKDRITLTLKVDEIDWEDLLVREKERLLQRICDDIWDVAKNADIRGKVKDGSDILSSFSVEADESINLDEIDIDVLDQYLDDQYGDWSTLDPGIDVTGDTDEIVLTVTVDETKWDGFTNSQQESLIQDICDDIWDEAEDADISVKIKAGDSTLESFKLNPGDDVNF